MLALTKSGIRDSPVVYTPLPSRQVDARLDKTQFESVVQEALDRLPEWVHDALDNIEIVVADEADPDLDPDGEGLLGLYVGTPLTERSVDDAGDLPDVIYLFRRAHLALELPQDRLREEIARTLIHEIAHYFGHDDDHLDEIGWA